MPEYWFEERAETSTHWVSTARLRIGFAWTGDRWTHRILASVGGEWMIVASAHEIDPSPSAPGRVVSPAYQQFHFQRTDAGAFALVVGQSGAHHFAASFQVDDDAASRIRVDVADRVRAPDAALACTYRVHLPPSTVVDASPAHVEWEVAGAGRLVISQAGPPDRPGRLVLAELGRSATELQITEDAEPGAPALRCRYAWRIEKS
jgi:hypothetical protein